MTAPRGAGPAAVEQRDRAAARVRAYRLTGQAGASDGGSSLRDLLADAVEREWHDVQVILHLHRFTRSMATDGDGEAAAQKMLEAAELSQDDALIAVSLAAQAIVAARYGQNPSPPHRVRDLPQAVALLDGGGGAAADRPTGYLLCSAAYHTMGLWELALTMFDRCERALAEPVPPDLQAINDENLVSLLTQRRNTTLALSAALIESGRREAAQHLAATLPRLTPDTPVLPGYELVVLSADIILGAIAQDPRPDDRDVQDALLARSPRTPRADPPGADQVDSPLTASRLLADALRAVDAGDLGTGTRLAEEVLAGPHNLTSHAARGLALRLAMSSALADPDNSALRHHTDHLTASCWNTRGLLLTSARTMIDIEKRLLEAERADLP